LVKCDLSRKQIASNGSANGLNTYKLKSSFLLSLDFAADSSCRSWTLLSNLLY